jgi:hypothetical protein
MDSLYDTHLEPTHLAVNGGPIKVLPLYLHRGNCTSGIVCCHKLIALRVCFVTSVGLPNSLVKKDQTEVSPLSRGVMSHPLYRFFHWGSRQRRAYLFVSGRGT